MCRNCIDKEKIIDWLNNLPNCWNGNLYYHDLIKLIENGEFDYE